MDQIAALPSTAIQDVAKPTFNIFNPLLQAHSATITAIPRATHRYGSHPRQKVDIYSPPTPSSSTKALYQPPPPILIFLYGGGFAGGDRILPNSVIPNGLIYANLGAFFATRGFTTLIPDYRRVNDVRNGEPAVYPSGADDIACLLAWVENGGLGRSRYDQDVDGVSGSKRHLFMLGNSAGGVHLATWLLAPQYEAARRTYLSESAVIQLSGAVLCAVPFHFNKVGETRDVVLKAYYGDSVKQNCPCGLLEALEVTSNGQGGPRTAEPLNQRQLGIPPLLNLEGELDPDDEILSSGREFIALWRKVFGAGGLEKWILNGHNHISPPVALMSGDTNGEKWGDDLGSWMREIVRRESGKARI